jgi:hypothetical protein
VLPGSTPVNDGTKSPALWIRLSYYLPERISQAMQFLHVLTAKTLLKNPMQFTGIQADSAEKPSVTF